MTRDAKAARIDGARELVRVPAARPVRSTHAVSHKSQRASIRFIDVEALQTQALGSSEKQDHRSPIAVFDSGLGGLTVVAEIRKRLPAENVVYFGDTARVPYGTKSSETVARFALENANFLLRFNPKLLVVACNTASAAALDRLRDVLPVPVCGVVEPGALAAAEEARSRAADGERARVAVLATESTVAAEAYPTALHRIDSSIAVTQKACPLLVPLVEEGRSADDPVVRLVLAEYLSAVVARKPAAVLLGCTHYPLLRPAIAEAVGADGVIVDSAQATARTVARMLSAAELLSQAHGRGTLRCHVSDNPERFATVGSRFLGEPIGEVAWVAPEHYVHAPLDERLRDRVSADPATPL